ncbi:MAG: PIN domain nuclease [Micromonosporaceae bacterium]
MTSGLLLADTSVWHWARHADARDALQPVLTRGIVATCAIVDAELMVSARGPGDADDMAAERRALHWLTTPDDVWDTVLATQRALVDSSRHRTVKIPDLIIAAVGQRHGATVLHYDADYDAIAEITEQSTRWLAPRGTLVSSY